MTRGGSASPSQAAAVRRGNTRWGRALRSSSFVAGSLLVLSIGLVALLAPVLAPYAPTAQDLSAGLLPPSLAHPFGTDQLGRDVLSRVLYATRTDLGIAITAAVTPFVVGVLAGLVSGYFGRGTDWVISRVTDTVIAFPFYVLVIAIVFAAGAGARGIIVAFALVGWVGYARVIRSLTAAMREQGWVRAAQGGGLSHARVLVRHILPNVLPQAVVLLATEIVLIMVAIVTLGFLGLGVQPPTPDWGTMIAEGQAFVTSHWWLSALPGLAVVLTGVALSLLGDGVGDALRVTGQPGRTHRARRARRPESSSRADTQQAQANSGPPGSVTVDGLVLGVRRPRPRLDPPHPLVGGSAQGRPAPGISFSVPPGEALGIVGESGSGKSLTLRAIAALLPSGVWQEQGEVQVGGRFGMVFQDPLAALDPLTRVGTQLREACTAAGAPEPKTRALGLLADVRLQDPERIYRAYPHELSGGQRQRVVIAIALAADPAVLLADEPTTALDVTVQREVLQLLETLRRERGLTLLLVSHDLAVVASVCERIVVMRGGEIVEAGDTSRVLTEPKHPYTRALLDAVLELPVLDAPVHAGAAAETVRESTPPVLAATDVAVRYGRHDAVAGVSFEVRGSLGLVGESGSGKTTLARAIAGELPIAAGSLTFEGEPLAESRDGRDWAGRTRTRTRTRRNRELRAAIQLIPQDPGSSLNPRLTVGSTLTEVLRVHAAAPRGELHARVSALLAEVGLDVAHAAAFPHELSGGQRQRVAIARALATSPRLLIADEATSALDVSVQAEIIALLARLRDERGLALLVISHDLAVVHELCDAVVVLRAGAVVEQGTRVLLAPRERYTKELLAAVARLVPPTDFVGGDAAS